MNRRQMLRSARGVVGLVILVLLLPLSSADAEAITPSFDRSVGKAGFGSGEFENPADVAIDESSNLWVVNLHRDQVQEFNAEGEFMDEFGPGGSHELSEPSAIAVSSGHIWIADTGHNRIEEFNLEGEFIRTVGSYGSKAGELWQPEGVAVDQEGHVWVADTANGRIQEFSEAGEFIREVGGSPPGESGPLATPTGIAVAPNGQIWATDWFGRRIAVFSSSGELLERFGARGDENGQFEDPGGLAFDDRGHAFVVDRENFRVEIFNLAGEYLGQFGSEGTGPGQFELDFLHPSGVAIGAGGGVWVADSKNNRLQRWQLPGYRPVYLSSFGSAGSEGGELEWPVGVARGSKGEIWVADRQKDRIDEFDAKGAFVGSFGEEGSEPGQLASPRAIALDSSGDIWTAETDGRVQEFDEAGELKLSVGEEGEGEGQFAQPEGLAIDTEDNVWVADTWNRRLQELSPEGEVKETLVLEFNEDPIYPSGIAIAPNGALWVAEKWGPKVFEIDPADGSVLHEFGAEGTGPGEFIDASGVLVDSLGDVWVADSWTDRLERFSPTGQFISQVGASSAGSEELSLSEPLGMASNQTGDLWIPDAGDGKIQKWKLPGYAAPECQPPSFTMEDDEELTLNDKDLRCEGTSPITFEVSAEPEHGSAATSPEATSITYNPNYGYSGADSFSLVAHNVMGESAPVTVWVEVVGGKPIVTYHFDEGEGAVAHDAVRNHDATINGATWTTGRYGDALEFDAESEARLTVPSSRDLQFPNGFTVEAWVNPSSPGPWAPLLTKQNGEGFSYGLFASGPSEGTPAGYVPSKGEPGTGVAGTALPEATWSYVALTYDGEDLRLYVNGELLDTHAAPAPETSSGALQIGADTFGAHYFDGKIDELRLYNSALSEDEVTPDTTPPETPMGFESVFEAKQTPIENEFEELELTEGEEGDTTISWNEAVDPSFPGGHPGSGVASYSYRYRRSGGEWTSWATTEITSIVVKGTTEKEGFEVEVTATDQIGNTSSVGSASLEGTPSELSAEEYGEEEPGESGAAPLEPEEREGEEEHQEEEEETLYRHIPEETQLAAFHPERASISGEGNATFVNELQERLCGEYPTVDPCGRYDGHDAAKYAMEWDLAHTDNDEARRDHNPRFEYYGGNGGDCTNFASQALKAGGMKFMRALGENDTNASTGSQAGNFHRGLGSWWTYYQTTPLPDTTFLQKTFQSSESFIKAPKLYEHLLGFGLVANVNRLARPRPGDLVFYNLAGTNLDGIDHAQVVVRVTQKAIWVAQHSPGYIHTMAYVVHKNDKPGHELGVDWNFWFVHPIYTAANIGTEIIGS